MILHIVLYQPKASATREELAELAHALEVASREIPSIRQVRVGKAVDLGFAYKNWPTDQNSGCVAVFEFADRESLDAYLIHQSHQKLAALFWKTCESSTVFDVSAIDPKVEAIETLFGQIAE